MYRQPTNEDVATILRLKKDRYTSDAIAVKLNLDLRIVRRVVRAASNPEPAESAPVGAVEKLEQVLDQLA